MTALGLKKLSTDGEWVEVPQDTEELNPAERLIRTDPQRAERDAMVAGGLEQGNLFDAGIGEDPVRSGRKRPEDAPSDYWKKEWAKEDLRAGGLSDERREQLRKIIGEDPKPEPEPEVEDDGVRPPQPANPLGTSKARPILGDDAKVGLPWDIVQALDPGTEADPAALLFLTLAITGNYLGRGPHAMGDHKENPG